MDDKGPLVLWILIFLSIVLYFGAIIMGGCDVKPSDAKRLLNQEGVSEYSLDGYQWLGCGRDDALSQGFHGTKNGHPVVGVICGGWLKDFTIRYK